VTAIFVREAIQPQLYNWIASRPDPVVKKRFSALAMTPDFYLFSFSTRGSHK